MHSSLLHTFPTVIISFLFSYSLVQELSLSLSLASSVQREEVATKRCLSAFPSVCVCLPVRFMECFQQQAGPGLAGETGGLILIAQAALCAWEPEVRHQGGQNEATKW